MNNIIFYFFYNLSQNSFLASLSLFFSYRLIYLVIFLIMLWSLIKNGKKFKFLLLFSLTGIMSWFFAHMVKLIFHIQRPFVAHSLTPLFYEKGFSFPSEHVAVITAFSFVVYSLNKKLGIALLIFSLLTGISRMIIGVHYPIDIIGGAVVGYIVAHIIIKIFKKI